MKCPRLDPPYKVQAIVDKKGTRRPLDALGVVVELRPGVEIEIDFAPHPSFAGHLVVFTPSLRRMKRTQEHGRYDDFAVFFGSPNVLHVMVERRVSSPPAKPRKRQRRGS